MAGTLHRVCWEDTPLRTAQSGKPRHCRAATPQTRKPLSTLGVHASKQKIHKGFFLACMAGSA